MKIEIQKSLKHRKHIKYALAITQKRLSFANIKKLKVIMLGKKNSKKFYGDADFNPKTGTAIIRLSRTNSDLRAISTMFHELKHVNQYSTGCIKDIRDGFKSRTVYRNILHIPSLAQKLFYWVLPWEIEARHFETKMMREICGPDWDEVKDEVE